MMCHDLLAVRRLAQGGCDKGLALAPPLGPGVVSGPALYFGSLAVPLVVCEQPSSIGTSTPNLVPVQSRGDCTFRQLQTAESCLFSCRL